jgi:hypothetical protein
MEMRDVMMEILGTPGWAEMAGWMVELVQRAAGRRAGGGGSRTAAVIAMIA